MSNTVLHCAAVLGEMKTTSTPVCSCKLESRGSLVTEFFTGLTKRTCGTFPHHLAVEAAMKSAHLTFIVYFTGAVRTDAF